MGNANVKIVDNMSRNATNDNIIDNYDFSQGLHSWHPNCCHGIVAKQCAVVTNRKESWSGLEQDITSKVSPGFAYHLSARVGITGHIKGQNTAVATLRFEKKHSSTNYFHIGKVSLDKDEWKVLEGTFSISALSDRVVFYIEGPAPGVDLLIESVSVTCLYPKAQICEKVSLLLSAYALVPLENAESATCPSLAKATARSRNKRRTTKIEIIMNDERARRVLELEQLKNSDINLEIDVDDWENDEDDQVKGKSKKGRVNMNGLLYAEMAVKIKEQAAKIEQIEKKHSEEQEKKDAKIDEQDAKLERLTTFLEKFATSNGLSFI
ncbi:hypothetical protein ACFE04_005438 [Oxalis oulophora]